MSGLDHASDSRALVTTDWDLDGDLDVWLSNRTSPRVRFLRNEGTPRNHFLAVRLVGSQGNRDAIGARVELHAEGEAAKPMVRTLRAGDGYLSQSSKWLHFGLGEESRDVRLSIHWPGGRVQEVANLKPDTRYRITEARGVAEAWAPPRRSLRLTPSVPSEPATPSSTRLVPHRRLPLPRLEYLAESGRREPVAPPRGGFKLLTLWATWCTPCLAELRELAAEERRLRAAGLEITTLNVDDPESDAASRIAKARAALEKLRVKLPGGVATASTIELLDVVQRVLVTAPRQLALPTSFLIDADGRLATLYRGRVSVTRLIADLAALNEPRREPRAVAVPFAGRWFTNPFPPDVLAIPRKLLEINLAGEALAYVGAHVPLPTRGRPATLPKGVTAPQLVEVYSRAGARLRAQNKAGPALEAFRTAVLYGPTDWNARSRFASLLQQQGRLSEALTEHRRTLQLRPDNLLASNNVAWILATIPDPAIRDPQEAIRRAEEVCVKTRRQVPITLDTLAAAYASAGRFEEAVSTAQAAIERAEAANETGQIEAMRSRLRLYEAGQAYVEGEE